ncbi:hypothetical protein J7L27_07650 [Candidatus Bathyarchaeota archaeon]|nr:hypothetical protein [Candidatus Bathyarchaeota archaeon]
MLKKILTIKKRGRIEPPSQVLLLIVYFSMFGIAVLTALEVAHMIVFHSWNNEIFAALTTLIGNVLGIFISRKA